LPLLNAQIPERQQQGHYHHRLHHGGQSQQYPTFEIDHLLHSLIRARLARPRVRLPRPRKLSILRQQRQPHLSSHDRRQTTPPRAQGEGPRLRPRALRFNGGGPFSQPRPTMSLCVMTKTVVMILILRTGALAVRGKRKMHKKDCLSMIHPPSRPRRVPPRRSWLLKKMTWRGGSHGTFKELITTFRKL